MTAPALRVVRAEEDPALRPARFDDYVGQSEVVGNLRGAVRAARRGGWQLDHQLFAGPAGLGKCLGEGTLVLLADGRTLAAEQIVVGNRLMGPDGKARTVLSTTTGRAPLYRIEPVKGESWVCNDVHVLTLVNSNTNEIIDISLDQWLTKSKTFKKDHKQFSVGVESFENAPEHTARPIDPYFLGVWFGDGTKALRDNVSGPALQKIAISKPDPEILALCEEQARLWELNVKIFTSNETRCPTYQLSANEAEQGEGGTGNARSGRWRPNQLLLAMRDLLGPALKIPEAYLRAPRTERLQFLAGICDTDGELADTTFVISQKREDWARDIWWLARSLGFYAGIKSRTSHYKKADGTLLGGTYWVVSISGDTDQIPTRIPRKQAEPRRQKKTATRTGFVSIALGEGDYYGFTLDGDGRFLLGDFTVTHNTSLARVIAAELGAELRQTSAPAIEHKGALASLLTALGDGDVLFIDEIHALDRAVAECLYTAMEDGVIDLPAGKKVIRVPLPKFTLLGATTHAGRLPKPLLDRFGFVWQLRPYTTPELQTIVDGGAVKRGAPLAAGGTLAIARASRGTPRLALRLLRRVRDAATNAAADGAIVPRGQRGAATCTINGPLAESALAQLGIDAIGLGPLDRRYLALVVDRPIGIEAICAALCEDRSTIEDVVEPFLTQSGLVARSGRGRVATDAGRAHLGDAS